MQSWEDLVKGETYSREAQTAWMHSLSPKTAYIEFVFNQGDKKHPLFALLTHLESVRTVGIEPGNGYGNMRHKAVKHRFAYDHDIIRAIDDLGAFFPDTPTKDQWTKLGDVDVVFLDIRGKTLGATVTHERMLVVPND